MTYIPTDKHQKGAFGDSMTSHKTPVVQIANKYEIDPGNLDSLEIFEATGGTADNNGNLFRCQTGTSAGGYGVIRSKETLNYRAGQGVEATITAIFTTGIASSLQFAGMFSLTETLAFGYNGTSFSVLHSYNGYAEIQSLQITGAASGSENATVTIDSDAVVIGITSGIGGVDLNAQEIAEGLKGDATVSGKWRIEQIDDTVYCIAKTVGNKTGTFSFSSATATASWTEEKQGAAKTDNHVAQASWNVTTTPFSGFDPTNLNIYKIQYGFLGTANISFYIYDPNKGDFVLVHEIEWANTGTATHLGSPNLKVGWTSASLGSSGTNLTVQGASAGMFLQGDEVLKNNTFSKTNSKASVSTTSTNIITIKNRLVYGLRHNLGKIIPLQVSIDNDHNKGSIIEIIRNPTVSGTYNNQYIDEFNSIAVYDTGGTTVTGGTVIATRLISAAGSAILDLTDLKSEILPEDTLVVAAKTISGTSTTITASITWKEEK